METKISAAPEAINLIKVGYSTAVNGVQDYNNKLLEFAQTNTDTALEFAQRLLGVKTPVELIELSTGRARNQFATLAQQTQELAALAQRITQAAAEPLKAAIDKPSGHAT